MISSPAEQSNYTEMVMKLDNFLCFLFSLAVSVGPDHAQVTPLFLKDSQSKVWIVHGHGQVNMERDVTVLAFAVS